MKYLLSLLVMALIIGLLIGTNIYLASSINFFFDLNNLRILYVLFGLTTLYMLFGGMTTMNATGAVGHFVNITAFTLLGIFVYLLLSTLLVDLTGLIINYSPKNQGVISIGLALLISIYGIVNARVIRTTKEDIVIPGLSKKVKAIHLTDTHLGHFRGANNLRKIVRMINKEGPEVVFFTGDFLDGLIQLKEESMQPLKDINAPVFFVEGNHDLYTGVDAIKKYLQSIGINVLTNEVTKWNGIQLIGLNHMVADSTTNDMHARSGRITIKSALESLEYNSQEPLILLHHGPAGIKHAAKAGVDLYLAGHTHGGQMFPATLVARAMFEYNRGLHRFKNTYVHISEGTGTFGPPMRVGTNSSMTILYLTPQ